MIVLGVAVSVASAFVLVPAILDRDMSKAGAVAAGSAATGETAVPAGLDWRSAQRDKPEFPYCFRKPVEQCVVVHGSGPRVMLIGDSHARMLLPAFEKIAQRDSLTLSVAMAPTCPWQQGLYYATDRSGSSTPPPLCRSLKDDWYRRLVPGLDPDIVVLAQYPVDDPNAPPVRLLDAHGQLSLGDEDFEERLRDASAQTIKRLRDDGRTVVIIEPIPITPESFNPIACLSRASFLDQCRYVVPERPTPLEEYYRQSARQPGVWSVDLDRLVCPYYPICDPVVHGLIVKRDNQHLTTTFAASLADDIEAYLRSNKILSDSGR